MHQTHYYGFVIIDCTADGFQITTTPVNGSAIYACSDTSIIIPFNFTANTTDNVDDIINVEWRISQSGQHDRIVAMMHSGFFNPMPEYNGKVNVSVLSCMS